AGAGALSPATALLAWLASGFSLRFDSTRDRFRAEPEGASLLSGAVSEARESARPIKASNCSAGLRVWAASDHTPCEDGALSDAGGVRSSEGIRGNFWRERWSQGAGLAAFSERTVPHVWPRLCLTYSRFPARRWRHPVSW